MLNYAELRYALRGLDPETKMVSQNGDDLGTVGELSADDDGYEANVRDAVYEIRGARSPVVFHLPGGLDGLCYVTDLRAVRNKIELFVVPLHIRNAPKWNRVEIVDLDPKAEEVA